MKDKLKKFYADRHNEIKIVAGVGVGIVLGVTYMALSQDETRVLLADVYEDEDTDTNRIRVYLSNGTSQNLVQTHVHT